MGAITVLLLAPLGAAVQARETSPLPVGTTTRLSLSTSEHQGDGPSRAVAISANGRYVAFSSHASNLVPGDTNRRADVFVRDRVSGTTQRVSVSNSEKQADVASAEPAISGDGRYVVFQSFAANLVPRDTNRRADIFIRDLELGTTRRVSVSSAEEQAKGSSALATISADGRFVAFFSYAGNLVPEPTNDRGGGVFVRDLKLGTTVLASVASDGEAGDVGGYGPAISANGRYVAFESFSTNLVPNDTNETTDAFVRDLKLGTTTRVSVSSRERQSAAGGYDVGISARGRYVVFLSYGSDLVRGDTNSRDDVFIRDRKLGTTRRVSVSSTERQADEESYSPVVSANGRYVAFASFATNLVAGDTSRQLRTPGDVQDEDCFVRDRTLGTTTMVSVSSTGDQGTWGSYGPSISRDGRYIAFVSYAPNLVPHDTNHTYDVFLRDRGAAR